MKPAEKCYQDCAVEAAEYQIGIDVFVCGSQPVDLATLGVLTRQLAARYIDTRTLTFS